VWNTSISWWEERYAELEAYKQVHGHCNVPQKYTETPGLGQWVHRQREEYLIGNLNFERKSKLDQIGFVWNTSISCWELRYAELESYKQVHGHCNVPQRYPETPGLGQWVNRQREENRSRNSNLEWKSKLDHLGFVWNIYMSCWEKRYDQLERYKQNHKDCNVPHLYIEIPGLGRWVARQRTEYRKDQIPPEREELLNKIGFQWRIYKKRGR
jgi:hypothetical protein